MSQGRQNSQEARPTRKASWFAKLALTIAAPLVVLGLIEGGLRLAGVGRNTDFFIPDAEPGMYRTNPRYTELFFPASFGLKPLNFRLPKAKPNGRIRIFVLGESAAMGVPEPAFGLAPQLRAQLQAACPGRQFEVYNLGITAINSHVIRHLARQALRFEPDLLVIYMGNNEVVGPYGPGSAITDRMLPLPLIRASLWLGTTRTGQLLQRALRGLGQVGRDFKEWRGMEMFAGRTVPADDPRLEIVRDNFRSNLADILQWARDAGTKVVLSTVAVNVRDSAPFASRHGPAFSSARLQEWQDTIARAGVADDLGEPARAAALFERAIEIDPAYADTHFQLAKVSEERGEHEAARRQDLEALQLDALRFRTDAALNRIIRECAAAAPAAIDLADAAREMGSDAASTVAPAGHNYFFEHVHLDWDGNFALARLLASHAAHALFGADPAPAAWLDPAACADALGYTDFGRSTELLRMDGLTGRPPFTGQLDFAANRTRLQREIARADAALSAPGALATAAAKIEFAREREPSDAFLTFQSAAINLQLGRFAHALALNQSLGRLEPPSPEAAAQRGFLLQQLGQIPEAENVLLASAATDPYYFQTYELLGNLWAATAQTTRATEFFDSLVARMPESTSVRLAYGQLLAARGDGPGAERQWRAVLEATPDNEAALAALVQRLWENQKTDDAVSLMLKAQAYNPRDFANNARLEQVFEERGDLENTIKYLRAMADSGPVRAALHHDLALDLAKLGRRQEMLVELWRARRAAADEGDHELAGKVDELIRQAGTGGG
jgi:tetratricopeptide (TPR) repeat protein